MGRLIGYFSILLILAGVSAIAAMKDVGILILFLTMGLGFPLLFAATGVAYGLCLFPAVALWWGPWSNRIGGATISIAATIGLAILPGMQAHKEATLIAASNAAKDHRPSQPISPTSIEIRRAQQDDAFLGVGEGCGYECKSLLAQGGVKWVRTVLKPSSGAKETRTFHALRNSPDCSISASTKPDPERCVALAADDNSSADLVIDFGDASYIRNKKDPFSIVDLQSTRTITASFKGAEVLRQTEANILLATTPLILGPEFSGMNSSGAAIVKSSARFNQLKLAGALKAVGLSPSPPPGVAPPRRGPRNWQDGLDENMTIGLVALLDLPQSEPFNSEQAKVATDWIMHARQVKVWTPDLMSILRRLIHDRRLKSPSSFDQIFERNEAVTTALLPDVLDLLDKNGIGQDYTPERQAAYTFIRLNPALLYPHAQKITGLMTKSPALNDILMRAVGRLGFDPSSYLLPIRADIDQQTSASGRGFPRLLGACFAEQRWSGSLIPALRAALRPDAATSASGNQSTSAVPQRSDLANAARERHFTEAVLKTLASLGDLHFVEAELKARPNLDPRLGQQIRNDLKYPYRVCSLG